MQPGGADGRARPAAPPVADPAALADIRSRLQALVGTQAAGITDPAALDKQTVVNQLISGDTSLILDGLNQAGVKLGQEGALDDLVKEASDYLWVQYRLGSYDKWIDVHPAFTDAAAAPTGLKIEKFYRDALPDDLYHRVRLQVTVEQKFGDKLIATPVVSNWERHSADLAGHPVTFQNQPDNFDPEKPLETATLIQQADVFVPILDGKMADRAFDLRGGTYSVSLLSSGTIGLAQSGQYAERGVGAGGRCTGWRLGNGSQFHDADRGVDRLHTHRIRRGGDHLPALCAGSGGRGEPQPGRGNPHRSNAAAGGCPAPLDKLHDHGAAWGVHARGRFPSASLPGPRLNSSYDRT